MAVTRGVWLSGSMLCCVACLACASLPFAQRAATYAAAVAYSADASGTPAFVQDAPSAALRATTESRAAATGSTLQPDGRLGLVARFLLAAPERSARVSSWAELAARHLGVYDAVLDASVEVVSGDPAAVLAALLTDKLGAHSYTHYGVALATRNGQTRLSLVLSARQLLLEPVPRSVPNATAIQLRGRLPDGVSSARVELLPPHAARAALSLGADREFAIQLPTAGAGLYRVEIAVDRAGASATLASVPIYVGVAAPRHIALAQVRHRYDLPALKARVLARLIAQRKRLGLPPLRRDSRLDDIAQQHSLDMRAHAYIGDVSPRTGDPGRRVHRAGLSPALVLETLIRAADAQALEASAADTTGQGRQLLVREVSDVGIGIVELPDAYGGTLLMTELFAQLTAAPDVADATPQLLSRLNQARSQRGSDPLALDPGLCEVATRAAQRFMSDASRSEQDTLDTAQRELGQFSLVYRRVNAFLTVTQDMGEAATLEPALEARAVGVGIGIARGQRPQRGEVLAVVMLVGIAR
jgi:uncharacterized protein YkwD